MVRSFQRNWGPNQVVEWLWNIFVEQGASNMSETKRFRCLNCGKRFETEVLSAREVEEARRERRLTSAIHCPVCNRTNIRDGWE